MNAYAMHTPCLRLIRGIPAHSRSIAPSNCSTLVRSIKFNFIATGWQQQQQRRRRCCCEEGGRRRTAAGAASAAAAPAPAHEQNPQRPPGIRPEKLPSHVAVIMDGNSRWAAARGMPAAKGHEAGVAALRRVVEAAGQWGVRALTVYALSTDNVARRPPAEVAFLYGLVEAGLAAELPALRRAGVRLRFIGARAAWPRSLQRAVAGAEAITRGNTGMLLTVALNYSSSDDLAAAARRLAEAVVRGALRPEDITPSRLAAALSTGGGGGSGGDSDGSGSGSGDNGSSGNGSGSSGDGGGPGPVDLLIRTSGTQRLSNFLLYECAYAELVFDPAPWPAYGSEQLEAALRAYAGRERRFGGRGGGGSSSSSSNGISASV